jgi:hypothetical protein
MQRTKKGKKNPFNISKARVANCDCNMRCALAWGANSSSLLVHINWLADSKQQINSYLSTPICSGCLSVIKQTILNQSSDENFCPFPTLQLLRMSCCLFPFVSSSFFLSLSYRAPGTEESLSCPPRRLTPRPRAA